MATIKISDLHTAGSELLLDSESYLNELTNEEGLSVLGGALAGALVSDLAGALVSDLAGALVSDLAGALVS
jgi:hypothetical protein